MEVVGAFGQRALKFGAVAQEQQGKAGEQNEAHGLHRTRQARSALSVTCRRQLSHIPNLAGLEGSLTSLAAAMASHEELYRSQVRPIAGIKTRRRVRPESHGCSPRGL